MAAVAVLGGSAVSCDMGSYVPGMGDFDGDFSAPDFGEMEGGASGGDDSSSGSGGNGNSEAGIVTAGEWNDLENWDFWVDLMTQQGNGAMDYWKIPSYWGLYTDDRFAVRVADAQDNPVCGAKVELLVQDSGDYSVEWTAISDNRGSAELWYNYLGNMVTDEVREFRVRVNGVISDQEILPVWIGADTLTVNHIVAEQVPVSGSADIAFIVDATGSMGDEIKFLKDDLTDIIAKVSGNFSGVSLRTAALFYRDDGDAYLTRADNFTEDHTRTVEFISKQSARGGGDYPEAVHTALERALQELSWETGNRARLAFLLLDAPPHYEVEVVGKVRRLIKQYAAAGIKIIPIGASGIDKKTEFLLRYMSMFTDGTYVFITDDSGVGDSHIVPSVGPYQVELLNKILERLILEYVE